MSRQTNLGHFLKAEPCNILSSSRKTQTEPCGLLCFLCPWLPPGHFCPSNLILLSSMGIQSLLMSLLASDRTLEVTSCLTSPADTITTTWLWRAAWGWRGHGEGVGPP